MTLSGLEVENRAIQSHCLERSAVSREVFSVQSYNYVVQEVEMIRNKNLLEELRLI